MGYLWEKKEKDLYWIRSRVEQGEKKEKEKPEGKSVKDISEKGHSNLCRFSCYEFLCMCLAVKR